MTTLTIEQILTRRISTVIPAKASLQQLLESGKKIKLYQGFDPSKPDLHIGHLVGLLQLKDFQDLGHEVIFLIGDFTGMIGDPTDKSATRPKLTREEVLANAQTYKDQAGKILNFEGDNPARIMFNSEWLGQLELADVLELSSNVTVQQLLERDMFQTRMSEGKPIHLHEFMYPLLQGYDSVVMEVDLEVGGNDQLFNMMMGRHLLKALKNKDKFVLTTKLITDENGVKIGKTTGNAVNLFGDPREAYGQIMAFPDASIATALNLATRLPDQVVQELTDQIATDPMSVKKRLALEVVTLCHGQEAATEAQTFFEKTVQNREVPDVISKVNVTGEATLLSILSSANLGVSNGERKRVVEQGGVELNGIKLTDPHQLLTPKSGDIIKYGKREFIKIIN